MGQGNPGSISKRDDRYLRACSAGTLAVDSPGQEAGTKYRPWLLSCWRRGSDCRARGRALR